MRRIRPSFSILPALVLSSTAAAMSASPVTFASMRLLGAQPPHDACQHTCGHDAEARPLAHLSDEDLKARLVEYCYDRKNPPARELIEQLELMTHQALNEYLARYNTTTAWHGTTGTPLSLTYSIVPDGLLIPADAAPGGTEAASDLIAKLDADFATVGGRSMWEALISASFSRWAHLSGVSFQRVTDDGAAWHSPGEPGLRGDIRLAGRRIDGPGGALAFNAYAFNGGDFVLDTHETSWALPAGGNPAFHRLQNVLMHEFGHGLGLQHICPANNTKLMEPYLSLSFFGPQHDDVRGVHHLYGDAYESNGTPDQATDLGVLTPGQTFEPSNIAFAGVTHHAPIHVTLTSLHHDGDLDYYRITLPEAAAVSVVALPIGFPYESTPPLSGECLPGGVVESASRLRMVVDLIGPNGYTVIAENTAFTTGDPAVLDSIALPAGVSYVRVRTTSFTGDVQLYSLRVISGPVPPPANDVCENAWVLVPGVSSVQSTIHSNIELPPTCTTYMDNDVWYTVTPPAGGTLEINTCGSSFFTTLTIFSGDSCGNLTEVACNEYGCGQGMPGSLVQFPVEAQRTYWVRAAGRHWLAEGGLHIIAKYAPPANDTCDAAQILVGNENLTASTMGATRQGDASCVLGSGADVWYRFDATAYETLTLSACSNIGGGGFDPLITVFTGFSCGVGTEIACDDDSGETSGPCVGTPGAAFISLEVVPGEHYYIRVASVEGNGGDFTFSASTRVGNDLCEDAYVIRSGSYIGRTTGAAREMSVSCASDLASDVYFRWTAPCNGTLTINTCHEATNFDTTLAIYTGACGSLVEVACNDDACNLASQIVHSVQSGVVYTIRVGGYGGAQGSFGLNVSSDPAPPWNDTCRTLMPIGPGTFTGTTACANIDDTNATCAWEAGRDVWFGFYQPCWGQLDITTCGSAFDTVLRVYTGSCFDANVGLEEVACNDDSACGLGSRISFYALADTYYYICLTSYSSASSGEYTLNVDFMPNLTCTGALPMDADGYTFFDTACAFPSGIASCSTTGNFSPALWYTFVATCDGEQRLTTCPSNFDTMLSVYTGACGSLEEIACNDDTFGAECPGLPFSAVSFTGVAGTTYTVRISGYGFESGQGYIHQTCVITCPCDWNRNGVMNSQDFFNFVTDFFNFNADFNQNGATDSQDFFDFVTCFFKGC